MEGLKCKNEKRSQKWVFLSWPNMTLTKSGFKTKFGLQKEERNRRERIAKGEKKRRGRERREAKQAKVWN